MLGDYRLVLPLPIKRSFGPFKQVHRAAFTQQGGPFGRIEPGDISAIFSGLPSTILALELPLLASVQEQDIPKNYQLRRRTNLTLDIDADYPSLVSGFSKTLRKKLRRYPEVKLAPARVDTVLEVYRASSGERSGLKGYHYQIIRNLMAACRARGFGHLYQLETEAGVLAAGFFPEYQGRIINLFGGSTPTGFREEGMARLLAAVIKNHLGQGNILDFEGSDIQGVADFFKSFGPSNSPYLSVKRKGLLG